MSEELRDEYDDLLLRHENLGKLLDVLNMVWRDEMARIQIIEG